MEERDLALKTRHAGLTIVRKGVVKTLAFGTLRMIEYIEMGLWNEAIKEVASLKQKAKRVADMQLK